MNSLAAHHGQNVDKSKGKFNSFLVLSFQFMSAQSQLRTVVAPQTGIGTISIQT